MRNRGDHVKTPCTALMLTLLPVIALSQPQPRPAVPTAAAPSQMPIAKYAREKGLVKCNAALELAERNLLSGSEYTFRAYHPKRSTPTADLSLFSAIVDSRKLGRNELGVRATLNLTVTGSQRSANACTTIYEQTVHHNANCVAVIAQMAPNAKQSSNPSLGSVLLEVTDSLSLTVIPVGDAQCVTIVKEVAFDVPIAPSPAR
jgi:hypothetical protein